MLTHQGLPTDKPKAPVPTAPKNFSTTFNPDGTMVTATPGVEAPAFPGLSPELIAALLAPSPGGGGPAAGPVPGAGRPDLAGRPGRMPAMRGSTPSLGSSPAFKPRRQVIVERPHAYQPSWAGSAPQASPAWSYDPDQVEYERAPPIGFAGAIDTSRGGKGGGGGHGGGPPDWRMPSQTETMMSDQQLLDMKGKK